MTAFITKTMVIGKARETMATWISYTSSATTFTIGSKMLIKQATQNM
jgi:hypothetical protein